MGLSGVGQTRARAHAKVINADPSPMARILVGKIACFLPNPTVASSHNRFLLALPQNEQALLAPYLRPVGMRQGDVLYQFGGEMTAVYFPHHSVVSVLSGLKDGREVEALTIGPEGMVGLGIFLGATVSRQRYIVQIPDGALRMERADFARLYPSCPTLIAQLGRYADATISAVAYSGACTAVHPLIERLARWLLSSHDRVGHDSFSLTQEFISQMLAVRRPTVSVVVAALKQAGCITYHRGVITILDRALLESAACECYVAIREQFEAVYTPPQPG
jgi:CRP-like cAMP-binding protein